MKSTAKWLVWVAPSILLVATFFVCLAQAGAQGGQQDKAKATVEALDNTFFYGEINKFSGSGGEILINRVLSGDDPATPGVDPDGKEADPDGEGPLPKHLIQRIDVGDRLAGIGVAHTVETLSRPPGLETYRPLIKNAKMALRAMEVAEKRTGPDGYSFGFKPLSPKDFSLVIEELSGGAVKISAESIPEGTMVLSFAALEPSYTLKRIEGSPAKNWAAATDGARHWNVGVAKPTDYWVANFGSDDVGLLAVMLPTAKTGTIRFGLSLLPGSKGVNALKPIEDVKPGGKSSYHDFLLSGAAVGTRGLDTPFPIGLRTEIVFQPTR